MPELKKIKLILEDGTVFEGNSFGCHQSVAGEVVFNTAMTGYPESLTDPSYKGQILVLTYPLIGNYGVPVDDKDEHGLPKFFESDRIHLSGLIVSDYSFEYSHWNAQKSLSQWLNEQKVPGIYGIDTRALTKKLRETGTMLGKIEVEDQPIAFYNPDKENQVAKVSTKEKVVYGKGKHKIVLVDAGCKYNIIRCLLKRDTTVIRVPWDYDFTKEDYDGVMLSNGPGDPQYCQETVVNIRKAFEVGKPIFGICMGNQLIGIASGAKTYKLKYGHRAHNHPVRKVNDTKCFITSQNHSFAIDNATLSNDWEPLFVNINDDTNEGIKHKSKPIFSAQFHPEAFSGPTDTEFLFDDFVKMIEDHKSKK